MESSWSIGGIRERDMDNGFSSLQGKSVREVKVLGLELVLGLRLLNSINICFLLNIFSMAREWRKYSYREVISNIPNFIIKIVRK